MEFQGRVATNIRIGRHSLIRTATAGNLFSHPTEGSTLGTREESTLTYKPEQINDFAKRPSGTKHWKMEWAVPLLETTLDRISNVHILSKAPHALQVQSVEGEYLNFVPFTNNLAAAPNGSMYAGMSYKFEVSTKKRVLTPKWQATMWKKLIEWQFANTALNSNGASGGSSGSGMVASAYDPDTVLPSNFVYVLINGVEVGIPEEEISLEWETDGIVDNFGRPYCHKAMVKAKITMGQSAANDLQAAWTKADVDSVISFRTTWDENFDFVNAVRFAPTFTWADKGRNVELEFAGEIPYSAITFNSGTKTATFNFVGV